MATKQPHVLAAQVVDYCHAHALSLDGLVDRIALDSRITDRTAARLIGYCEAHTLTLGGLVSEVAEYFGLASGSSIINGVKLVHADYLVQARQFKAEGNIRGAVYMLAQAAEVRILAQRQAYRSRTAPASNSAIDSLELGFNFSFSGWSTCALEDLEWAAELQGAFNAQRLILRELDQRFDAAERAELAKVINLVSEQVRLAKIHQRAFLLARRTGNRQTQTYALGQRDYCLNAARVLLGKGLKPFLGGFGVPVTLAPGSF